VTSFQGRCWACGSASLTASRRFKDASLAACRDCGLVFAPDLAHADVREIYGQEYFAQYAGAGYDVEAPQRRHETHARLTWISRWVSPPGRLLEIGAAAGYFLEGAAAAGWTVAGVEPAADQAAAAQARVGVPVHVGFLEDVHLESRAFDVACGWHVLEHIPDPLNALAQLREALRGKYA
jgi:2-polyprenyl-3-methyl-5-hydroxy-6-metoxy-1,4-benzoquinol methylase